MAKIVIIEDENIVRENLKELLELFDHEVFDGENGMIGLELIKKHKPDIILCDINMPEMNGWEFLDEYNQLDRIKSDVYILTSSLDTRDKLKSREYDVVKGYFDKPLKHHYITEIIEQHV